MTIRDESMTVRMQRIIPARPHQVYRGWLEPELIGRWMSPGPAEASRAEVAQGWAGTTEPRRRRNLSGPWRRRRRC